jgi:hypothetical protein
MASSHFDENGATDFGLLITYGLMKTVAERVLDN